MKESLTMLAQSTLTVILKADVIFHKWGKVFTMFSHVLHY